MGNVVDIRLPARLRRMAQTLALSALPAAAFAQATAGAATDDGKTLQLDTVKVTAERRETALQKTPVSVGVIDSQELGKTGFQQLFDISKSVAGVSSFEGASNQQSSIFIRGVGTTNQGYTQAVGVYVDDVPLARAVAAGQWDLPDIERIEVLRGPQGTLYGQDSTGGAVRIISRNPTDDKVGWISMGFGNYLDREVHGYFSGPIREGLLDGSVAFSYRKNDGYGENLTTGQDIYATDVAQARAKLRLRPGNGWDAMLSVDGLIDKSDNGTNATALNYGNTPPRDTYTPQDLTKAKLVRGGISLNVTRELNDQERVRSITSYRAYDANPDYMDIGGLPRDSDTWNQTIRQNLFFQEFQLQGDLTSRLSHTTGVTFQREIWKNDNWSYDGLADGVTVNRQLSKTEFDTNEAALYSEFNYRLTDRLTATAGARYYWAQETYDGSAYALNSAMAVTGQNFAVSGLRKTSSGFTPRLTLGYQLTPQAYTYASYTQGAKFGGYNRSASTAQVATVAVNPEKVTAYEIGLKTSSFGNRLQVNADLFYNDYRDYQALVVNPTINGVLYNGSVLTNAAKAATYGGELEARARLARGLDWNFSLGYVYSEFKDFAYSGSSYVGNSLPFAPRLTISTGLSYTQPLSNGDRFNLYGLLQFTSKQYSDLANTTAGAISGYANVDLGANYKFAGRHWSAGIKVRNLLNRDQVILKTYIAAYGVDSAAYAPPRTIIGTVRYDF
ncbi:TonB-dependent receptor [Paraburkholderia tropica]|uniref:TonB-dependent receptor n=1 Tax=Paraburkholderia tropica TaxID=92647 RepID=UPI002AB0AA1C|nr:TonB-dependent receptor [Paraburkholderia tropica]